MPSLVFIESVAHLDGVTLAQPSLSSLRLIL